MKVFSVCRVICTEGITLFMVNLFNTQFLMIIITANVSKFRRDFMTPGLIKKLTTLMKLRASHKK
jgi:hypothetical protein